MTGAAAYFASRSTPQEDPYLLLGPGIICLNIPYSALAMLPLNNAMLDAQKEGEKGKIFLGENTCVDIVNSLEKTPSHSRMQSMAMAHPR